MNRSAGRSTLAGAVALFLSAVMAAPLFAQAPPLSVTATAGIPWPNTIPVGQAAQVTLSATAYNAPSVNYPCTLQPPMWGWSTGNPPAPMIPVIQYRATANGAWAAWPNGCAVFVSQVAPDPTQSNSCVATLNVYCMQPGYWRISPVVTVTYTDSCMNHSSATAQVTVADITALGVMFMPSSVTIQTPGQSASVSAMVMPVDAGALVTFDTYDHTVATVTGSSSSSPVPLTVMGVGAGGTNLVAWLVGSTYCMAIPVAVGVAPAKQWVPLGPKGITPTGPGLFETYVPTAAGGVLNITVDGIPLGNPITDPKGNVFKNNTDTVICTFRDFIDAGGV